MIKLKLLDEGTLGLKANYEYKSRCKKITGGNWLKKDKMWVYPVGSLLEIHEVFSDEEFRYYSDVPNMEIPKLVKVMERRQKVLSLLKSGEKKPRTHEFLMEHQRLCRDIAKIFPRFGFFLDTGTGKTVTALQAIKDKGKRALVICPKSIIKTAWVEDARDFYPNMKVLPLSRNMKKDDYKELMKAWGLNPRRLRKAEMKEELRKHAETFIINPESFKTDVEEIIELNIKTLVIDESAMIKNHASQTTKTITRFARTIDYVYELSGKPAPNTDMEYFSQMRIIDPALLGTSFYRFRNKYYIPSGYMGYDWEQRPGAKEEIAKKISRRSLFISKDDCLDLPEKTYLTKEIELTGKARRHYKEMEEAQLLILDDDMMMAQNKLTSIMKLRQITSGFVLSDEIGDRILHKKKLQELEETLEQIGDKQVIIWGQFKKEIRMIREMLEDKGKTVVTAYSETKDTDESINAFKHGEAQYIIAHPQTLKYGVTFTKCTYAVYYSLSYSYEGYYQSHDRIYRKGQTKPCTFIFLICKSTIDETIYEVLKEKGTKSKMLEELAKRR